MIDTVYFGLMETSQRDKIEYKYSIRTQNITLSLGKMFPENIILLQVASVLFVKFSGKMVQVRLEFLVPHLVSLMAGSDWVPF